MGSPDFQPNMQIITGITNAVNASVTTSGTHSFLTDEVVMIVVPDTYGMRLRYINTKITVTGATTFTCDIDTSRMDPFVIPGFIPFSPAFCCPVSGLNDNVATY